MNLSFWFLLYIIYSILGWIMEVINTFINKKRFVNRGFLIGPYCPIYGKGALLVIYLLKDYLETPLVLFILSIVICSVIEYFGSYILEKIFKTSWWDYSNQKYNINGRICLETMIPFGIGCLLVMYLINPLITNLLFKVSSNILNIIAITVFIFYLADIIISAIIIWKFKTIGENARKDNTEIVTEYVKKELLNSKKILYTRLIHAFPRLKILSQYRK